MPNLPEQKRIADKGLDFINACAKNSAACHEWGTCCPQFRLCSALKINGAWPWNSKCIMPQHPGGDAAHMPRGVSLIDFRPILFIVGILLCTLAVGMFVPALVDLYYGQSDWIVFSAASVVSLFVGGALIMMNRMDNLKINSRQAFILTTLSWV
ncbi:MAG: hypothetical protein VW550_17085, partial [Thalassospira sp.]